MDFLHQARTKPGRWRASLTMEWSEASRRSKRRDRAKRTQRAPGRDRSRELQQLLLLLLLALRCLRKISLSAPHYIRRDMASRGFLSSLRILDEEDVL